MIQATSLPEVVGCADQFVGRLDNEITDTTRRILREY